MSINSKEFFVQKLGKREELLGQILQVSFKNEFLSHGVIYL